MEDLLKVADTIIERGHVDELNRGKKVIHVDEDDPMFTELVRRISDIKLDHPGKSGN